MCGVMWRTSGVPGVQVEKDIVVFDEERASYVSSTDYRSAYADSALHEAHARLLAQREGASADAADAQGALLAQIRELEAAVVFQQGALQAARDVEERARCERDAANRACARLQQQVRALAPPTCRSDPGRPSTTATAHAPAD
jgi:hypothetical protein